MFITSIYIARITLKKSLILILFSIILILNTQESIIYNISAPGDKYYPTKLIFEKHEIIFGNKDIAEFVKNYMVDKNRTTIKIIAIGLNDLSLWSDIKLDKIYDWHYNNFDEYKEILSNFKKDDILLVHATAIKKRNNKYYKIIHDKNSVTEVDPKYYEYILKNINEYELIYTSKDGYSKIYKKLCN
jgi:hypothetical protein